MSRTLVLMPGDALHWLRIADGAIVAQGRGGGVRDDDDDRIVAVVSAHDVTVHHVDLPDLSEAQVQAAARLLVAAQSAASPQTLHIAVGQTSGAGDRPVVAIDRAGFVTALADLHAMGHDPDVVIAAPLLLARPATGYVRGDFWGETIVRGHDSAFADDPVLTPLLTDGAVTTLARDVLDRDLIDAVLYPEVNLRQGVFAKKRDWALDEVRLRRIGWLALAVAATLLFIQIVQLVRLTMAADRIEADNLVIARAALPPGASVNSPLFDVQAQLTGLRGPGGGMLPMAALVANAAQATTNLELTAIVFDGGGTLRVTARAATVADLALFENRLTTSGLTSASGPAMVDQGRHVRDFTVSMK